MDGIDMEVYPLAGHPGKQSVNSISHCLGRNILYITFGTLTRHHPDYSRLRYYYLNMQLPIGFSGNLLNNVISGRNLSTRNESALIIWASKRADKYIFRRNSIWLKLFQ